MKGYKLNASKIEVHTVCTTGTIESGIHGVLDGSN